ncbi:MAG TPA: beta-ketoacyl synthase N-terminal-like domain-containing protein [Bacteroidia bacterium]|nr:beta-ketoacyl synthase N-terminal-like domain-containing protein [Bacteroidia bacterium]
MKKVFVSSGNIVSPLGFSAEENFKNVADGISGLQVTDKYSFSKESFCVAALNDEKTDTVFSQLENPGNFTRLEKASILSIAHVLKSTGIELDDKNTLLIYATTKGNIDLLDGSSALKKFDENRVYITGMVSMISRYFKCANEPVIVSNACISGLLAILIAKRMLEAGLYKHIVVAAGDIVSEFTLSGFKVFNALSGKPCKPFDAARQGINLGEAAAALVLGTEKFAGTDEIKIINGSGSNDANHISGPSRNGEGLFQSVLKTTENFPADTIDFISAHGTATPFNDEMEAIAFSRAGLKQVPLNGLKGYFGHTLGAAGLIETIISIEALKQNMLIATKGYETHGVSENINIIRKTEKKKSHTFLKTSSGFGGCNASILFSSL